MAFDLLEKRPGMVKRYGDAAVRVRDELDQLYRQIAREKLGLN